MPRCAYCNSTIIFGGVRDGDLRFCNRTCWQQGALLSVAQHIPETEVRKRVDAVHQGACPICQRVGAVDVHTSHSIWSALVLTSWKSSPQVSCVVCGRNAKIKATLFSLFLGWWGFPWGLILTPVQIIRNLWGLATAPASFKPSAQLEKLVRLSFAEELQRAQSASAVPPPLTEAGR